MTHDLAEAAALATRVLIYTASPATIAADIAMPGAGVQEAEQMLRRAFQRAANSLPAAGTLSSQGR